ncbi:hypothetical protein AB6A40_010002 [Gnathostoma spinigerum]|uniref:Annexin n=1 Tax=Gnathostoma spinigerum TaxID=75299 RepID=A0ABD6F0Y9_9BILA
MKLTDRSTRCKGLDEKKQEAWDRVVFACPSVDTDVLDMILLVQRDLSTNAVLEEYRKFVDFKRCWLQLRSDEQSIESISTSSLQSTVGTSLDAFNENARSQAKAALVNSLVQAGLDRAKLEVLLDKEQGNLDADRIVQIYFDHEYASISGSG